MLARALSLCAAVALAVGLALAAPSAEATTTRTGPGKDGIIKVKSGYGFDETVTRIKKDIADKGIVFFSAIDQQKLASDAKITLPPSTLLIFGNPALGTQFITAKGEAGLDWPVRLLVQADSAGQVWAIYTDFDWIKRRHRIKNRDEAFAMATKVITSITQSIEAKQ